MLTERAKDDTERVSGEVVVDMHGYWVRGYELVDLDAERSVNTFFHRENAERKKENLAEYWPEYSEETLSIVEVLVDVS
jgi:hypothetical protein